MKTLLVLSLLMGFIFVGQSGYATMNGRPSLISQDSSPVDVAPSAGSAYAKENDPRVLQKPCAFAADGQGLGRVKAGVQTKSLSGKGGRGHTI